MPKTKTYSKMVGVWLDPETVKLIDEVTENRSHYIRCLIDYDLRRGYQTCQTCGGLKPTGAKCLCGGGVR